MDLGGLRGISSWVLHGRTRVRDAGCAGDPPILTEKILQPLLLRLLNARFERPSEALAQRLA